MKIITMLDTDREEIRMFIPRPKLEGPANATKEELTEYVEKIREAIKLSDTLRAMGFPVTYHTNIDDFITNKRVALHDEVPPFRIQDFLSPIPLD